MEEKHQNLSMPKQKITNFLLKYMFLLHSYIFRVISELETRVQLRTLDIDTATDENVSKSDKFIMIFFILKAWR